MKIHDVQQGSDEWVEIRLGKPTASEFHRIMTPTARRNKETNSLLSAQAKPYAYRLIVEELLRRPTESLDGLEWVEHGKASESEAVKVYEFMHDVEAKKVGFITTDNGLIGCSPDRLVGKNGAEFKCPSPQVHIGYLLDGPGEKYKPQVQGQNYVGEFEFVDFFSHNVDFKPVEIRTYRDEPYIKLLQEALDEFCEMKAAMLEKIKKEGYFTSNENFTNIVENSYQN